METKIESKGQIFRQKLHGSLRRLTRPKNDKGDVVVDNHQWNFLSLSLALSDFTFSCAGWHKGAYGIR